MIQYAVPIARDGIFRYKGHEFGFLDGEEFGPNDDILVYRAPSVFTKEVLDSMKNIPFSNDHPKDPLNSENARKSIVGILGEKPYFKDGVLYADKIIIYDQETIDEINLAGKKEVSIGFEAHYDFSEKGEKNGDFYVATESIGRVNHLSLVSKGKAGPEYRLHHKQQESNQMPTENQELVTVSVNGVSVNVPKATADALNAAEQKNSMIDIKNSINSMAEQIGTLASSINEMVNEKKCNEDESEEEKGEDKENSEDEKDGDKENSKNEGEKTEDKENRVGCDEPIKADKVNSKNSEEDFSKEVSEILFSKNSQDAKLSQGYTGSMANLATQIIDGKIN